MKMKKIVTLGLMIGLFVLVNPVFAEEIKSDQQGVTTQSVNLEKDYSKYSAEELAELVRSKKVTSEELVKQATRKVNQENPALNAVIGLREEAALKEAREIQDTGQPFLGVPILVKGLGHTIKGMPNSNGFPFAKDQIAGGTSSFVKALQNAGFIVIGQTNFPEMGWRNITDSALYGPTGSPWNPNYQAGGSSGGAAASIASGMNPVASGSDAGGSIRIPASWNGIVGLKPSRGVLKGNSASTKGQVVHFANTKYMNDTRILFNTLKNDPTAKGQTLSKDMKIAYSTESPVGTPVTKDALAAVENAVAFLKSQGYQVEEAKPEIDGVKLMENYYTIAAGSGGMAEYLGNQILKRPITIDDVDILTWALFQTGKVTTKDEINAAWDFNHQAEATMAEFHKQYPIYLTPTTASTAPKVGDPLITPANLEKMKNIETASAEDRKKLIYDQWLDALTYTPYTQLANLTGEPAISLPTYVSNEGLPLGIQFNAGFGNDELLMDLGDLFETNSQFKLLENQEPETEPSTSTTEEGSSTVETISTGEANSSSTENASTSEASSSPTESTVTSESTKTTNSSTTHSKTGVGTVNSSSNKKEWFPKAKKILPQTGEENSMLLILFGVIGVIVVLAYIGFKVEFKKTDS
ncbi:MULTISPECIES: amidase family protein [Vagococcus]|uniref:6-aminohexanoate-cyclic-dimer hydrolase n=1 Tax=Vagococcus fluvialis bH819 TaxID=1255619 RepID=A0A1X6WK75_9ENTE|nr:MULTISPECIES: amidase family protein [Vagococcus]SLM84648.1 6-aminohexanoate-cyclic-dimer hydrolase [Vagococcus fluvialis bH819]HCM89888.1 LPXTG cell wall anchor domain-containing protein [Vagococcus sp.]